MIDAPVHQEILFFDDFDHQTSDKVHWDHVRFSHPVFLDQVRVIPKDCVIPLKNGVNRVGKTFPNNFRIEFYANNLNKKEEERATLEKIGSILFNDEDTHNRSLSHDLSNFTFKPSSIPLDWLVIVGGYSSLTVAFVGVKAKQSSPQQNSAMNPSSAFAVKQPSGIAHQERPSSLMHTPPFVTSPPILNPSIQQSAPLLPNPTLPPVVNLNNNNNNNDYKIHPQPYQAQIRNDTFTVNNARFQIPQTSPTNFAKRPSPQTTYRPQLVQQSQPTRPTTTTTTNNFPKTNESPQTNLVNIETGSNSPAQTLNANTTPTKLTNNNQQQQQLKQSKIDDEIVVTKPDLHSTNLVLAETNLLRYLDLDEDKDEQQALLNLPASSASFSSNTISKDLFLFDEANLKLLSSFKKNPLSNRLEQLLDERAAEMNEIERGVYEAYGKEFNLMWQVGDEEGVKLLESLNLDLSKYPLVFYHLFRNEVERFEKFMRLINETLEGYLNLPEIKSFVEMKNKKKLKIELNSFRMRKIKIVLKMSDFLLCNFDQKMAENLIFNTNFQTNLLNLITEKKNECVISLPIKLKCLNTLNNSIKLVGLNGPILKSISDRLIGWFSLDLSSRLISAATRVLNQLSFFNNLAVFIEQSHEKFLQKSSRVNDENLNECFQAIFVYCIRMLRLNSNLENEPVDDEKFIDENEDHLELNNESAEFDFAEIPMQNLFDKFASTKLKPAPLAHLLHILNETKFFSYLLMFYSNAKDKKQAKTIQLVDEFLFNLLTVNKLNDNSFVGIEYLIKKPKLAKCIVNIFSQNVILVEKISFGLKTLPLIHLLSNDLKNLTTNEFKLDAILLSVVEKVQSLAFFFKDTKPVLISSLSSPDGNFSNEYVETLLDWLEFLIIERNFINEPNETLDLRCYSINSLIEVFYSLVESNEDWRLPTVTFNVEAASLISDAATFSKRNKPHLCLSRLNHYVSLLINQLTTIRAKQNQQQQQNSLNNLINKLKVIRVKLEPINSALIRHLNNETSLAARFASASGYYFKIAYLNNLIDFFKKTLDKNLGGYFVALLRRKSLFCEQISANVVVLLALRNSVCFDDEGSEKRMRYALSELDLNRKFNARRFLGHLLSRNFLPTLLALLGKLADYLMFYSRPHANFLFSSVSLNKAQIGLLLALLEPCLALVHLMLSSVIRARGDAFKDTSALPVLFRFYAVFNYCFQNSLKLHRVANVKVNEFERRIEKTNKALLNTCGLFCFATHRKSSLCSSLYKELCRFCLDRPFNFAYGLNLLSELLPLPLPILINDQKQHSPIFDARSMLHERKVLGEHLEPLLVNEKLRRKLNLFDEITAEKNCGQFSLCGVIRALCVSSKCGLLARRVCVQLSDLSERMGAFVLRCLLDYAVELMAKLHEVDDDEEASDNEANLEPSDERLNFNEILEKGEVVNEMVEYKVDEDIDSIDYTNLIDANSPSAPQPGSPNGLNGKSEHGQEMAKVEAQMLNESVETKVNSSLKSEIERREELSAAEAKSTAALTLARLLRFLIAFINYERPGAQFGQLRAQIIHLMSDKKFNEANTNKTKVRNVYLKLVFDLVKLAGEKNEGVDENVGQARAVAQEAVFLFIEAIIRNLPDVFIKNYNHTDSESEDAEMREEKEEEEPEDGICSPQFRLVIDLIHLSLIEHLSGTELDSLVATNAALNSLILLTKLYKKLSVEIDPILGHYLRDPILFTNLMRTLDARFLAESAPLFIDVLSKFFIYSDQLAQTLTVTTSANQYLKDLFDWSSSKFNVSDLQIDQIPIFKSNKQRPNNKNSLDNLLVLIEGLDTNNCKKAKFCLNQAKRLVNTLNEIKETTQEPLLKELDHLFGFRIFEQIPVGLCSKTELKIFFSSRQVYLCSESWEEYESEWIEPVDKFSLSLDEAGFMCEMDLSHEAVSACVKSDVENLVSGLVLEKNLGKELVSGVEQAVNEEGLNEPQAARKSDSPVENADRAPSKTPDMINTRTGARYKAPMRGGHSNPMGRQMMAPANTAGLRHDPFRTRQPNTSRPPSLHVDEFYRLEMASARDQQQQQQQQQKILNQNQNNQDKTVNGVEKMDTNSPSLQGEPIEVLKRNSDSAPQFDDFTKPKVENIKAATLAKPIMPHVTSMPLLQQSISQLNSINNNNNNNSNNNNSFIQSNCGSLGSNGIMAFESSNKDDYARSRKMSNSSMNEEMPSGDSNEHAQFNRQRYNNINIYQSQNSIRERSLSTGNLANLNSPGMNTNSIDSFMNSMPPPSIPPPPQQSLIHSLSSSLNTHNGNILIQTQNASSTSQMRLSPSPLSPQQNSPQNLRYNNRIQMQSYDRRQQSMPYENGSRLVDDLTGLRMESKELQFASPDHLMSSMSQLVQQSPSQPMPQPLLPVSPQLKMQYQSMQTPPIQNQLHQIQTVHQYILNSTSSPTQHLHQTYNQSLMNQQQQQQQQQQNQQSIRFHNQSMMRGGFRGARRGNPSNNYMR